MIILTVRTDKPEAEIGLFEDGIQLSYEIWQAHRQLAETLHDKIRMLLQNQGMTLQDIKAIACFQGPGSFTGLRIGLTVANALAYALRVPVVAQMDTADANWKLTAMVRLQAGETDIVAMPEYGSAVNITLPKQISSP